MNDTLLEKLGNVFVALRIRERFGITFERYIKMYENGTLKELW